MSVCDVRPRPKTPHDQKKSVKLSLERIELLKKSYEKYHNYRLVGRIFHVNHKTVIYHVDENYRKESIKTSTAKNKIRMNDTEYRDKINALKRKSNKARRDERPDIREWEKEYKEEYKKRGGDEKKKEWISNNREKINKLQNAYYRNIDTILAKQKEKYKTSKQ